MTTKEDMDAFYAVEDAIRSAGPYVHRDDFEDEPPEIFHAKRKTHDPYSGECLRSSFLNEHCIAPGIMQKIEEWCGGGRLGKSIVKEALGKVERREWQALCRPQDRLSF